jgi:hypothetical protein
MGEAPRDRYPTTSGARRRTAEPPNVRGQETLLPLWRWSRNHHSQTASPSTNPTDAAPRRANRACGTGVARRSMTAPGRFREGTHTRRTQRTTRREFARSIGTDQPIQHPAGQAEEGRRIGSPGHQPQERRRVVGHLHLAQGTYDANAACRYQVQHQQSDQQTEHALPPKHATGGLTVHRGQAETSTARHERPAPLAVAIPQISSTAGAMREFAARRRPAVATGSGVSVKEPVRRPLSSAAQACCRRFST